MSKFCINTNCRKDLSKYKQLDFSRPIICDECTMSICAGVPEEKIQKKLPKRFSKQRKRNNK